MSRYLKTCEAAKILGVCESTIRKLYNEGILEGPRIGRQRHRRITVDSMIRCSEEYGIDISEFQLEKEESKVEPKTVCRTRIEALLRSIVWRAGRVTTEELQERVDRIKVILTGDVVLVGEWEE